MMVEEEEEGGAEGDMEGVAGEKEGEGKVEEVVGHN